MCVLLSATGLEEIRKLKVQLQSLDEQVSTGVHTTLQPFKKKVKSSYTQCCTVSRKIEKEQSAYKENIEQLRKDKSQLEVKQSAYEDEIEQLRKDKVQLVENIEDLRKQLTKKGISQVSLDLSLQTLLYYR